MTTKKTKLTYSDSGVDIDEANQLIDNIKPIVRQTLNKNVLSNIGGFGALYELDINHYKKPVLVSGTDGVGTKIMLAKELSCFDQIGIDLVAMCVNDVITLGAKPLFFLDYFATSKLKVSEATNIIKGIAEGCLQSDIALIGGETAEMPGVYQSGDFDLAGFCVGVVDYEKIIDGQHIKPTDSIIGIESSGPHSNGYSLIRKIIEVNSINLQDKLDNRTLGEAIIQPTTIYAKAINHLQKTYEIHGMAHITGGGFKENIVRILPENINAEIDLNAWQQPEVFNWIQTVGNVDHEEMLRTFNCGIGYVLVVSNSDSKRVINKLAETGHNAFLIGEITTGKKEVRLNL
ncbi:MAG TPA: phosphoribosylformylglycinamidine cyclo-ligase [Gammaproteobacteria bacterium]|jgi:phosphoribosylformylglycinamidine cyclo-ligase|nr:phosphoribosylformylglycinamidine cyclo-ligase [Gammaproteobacteria bacterium]HIK77160.1 phosphoribosylformylglycinamidine cyclo-ligase [Gammaproteobacteria bacterium]